MWEFSTAGQAKSLIASRVLDELKERLSAAYGARLHPVVLFGSEVRGNARPVRDIDLSVQSIRDPAAFPLVAR